jgi:hypothetical protein
MCELYNPIKALPRKLGALLAAICVAITTPAAAQGDLLVAPTRLVIDSRGTGQVILSNIGNEEETYRITAELRRMTTDGDIETIDPANANEIEKAALEMIRFAPRRVILPPGQPQSIRVSARPPADLPDGEYRIHLSFNAVPKVAPVVEQPADGDAQGVSVRLIPIYGIAIPIIVRKGRVEASATIANPRIETDERGRNAFKLDMARSGSSSVFGDILAFQPGQSDPVYRVRGIAVYPEIESRVLDLAISPEQAAALKSGRLRIEYREPLENGGALLASFEGVSG